MLSNSIQSGYVAVILQAEGRRYIRLAQDVALLEGAELMRPRKFDGPEPERSGNGFQSTRSAGGHGAFFSAAYRPAPLISVVSFLGHQTVETRLFP